MSELTPLQAALEDTRIPRLSETNFAENHEASQDRYAQSVVFKVLIRDGVPFDEAEELSANTPGSANDRLKIIRSNRA